MHLFSENEGSTDMTIRGVNNILSVPNDGNKVYYSDNTDSDITQLVEYNANKQKKRLYYHKKKQTPFQQVSFFDDNIKPISIVPLYGKPIRLHSQDS